MTATRPGRPAEHLETAEGLVVRRFGPPDVPALHQAVLASVEQLRPWMPWAVAEPRTLDERREVVASFFDAGWDEATSFGYGIFDGDEVVGACGLHTRIGPAGMDIGYWVRTGRTGRGIATSAAAALVDAAFRLDHVDHVEIHHDQANTASARVPAKLGFALVEVVDDEIGAPGETGGSCRWRLVRPA